MYFPIQVISFSDENATLGSILDSDISWESCKMYLQRGILFFKNHKAYATNHIACEKIFGQKKNCDPKNFWTKKI